MIRQSRKRVLSAVVLLLVSVVALVILAAQAPMSSAKPQPEVPGGVLLSDLHGPKATPPAKSSGDPGVVNMSTWEETGKTSAQRR